MITESDLRINKVLNDYCTVYVTPSRGSSKPFIALYEYIKLLDSGKRIIFVDHKELQRRRGYE